jgi:sulfonate transport system substrate-binding protein
MSKLHVRAAFAVAAALLVAAGCGGDDSGSATTAGATDASTAGSATGDDPAGGGVLKIADPGNAGAIAYAKREGILEARLAEIGATVEWGGSYPNSTASFDAVRAGELNIFGGNTTVTVGYLSVTPNAKVVALGDEADPTSPPSAGLFVNDDIDTVQDLVGKKIGVNVGGYGEYLLLLGLQQAGVDPAEVERVNLQADKAAAAFVGGSVDGYVAIVNAFQPAVEQGFKLLFSNRDVPDQSVSVVAVAEDLVNEHPEVVKVYLDVLQELTEQSRTEPEKFQNVFLTEGPTAVSGDRLAAAIALAEHTLAPHTPTAEDIAKFQHVADVFYESGAIPETIDAATTVVDIDSLVGSGS